MKLYYIANARMPAEKAYAIQIAKMCEAFVEAGVDVTLVVPRRATPGALREYYGLRTGVPLLYLPALGSLYRRGRVGFLLSSLVFMLGYVLYLGVKRLRGERFVAYSVDMDTFSFVPLALFLPRPFVEMHGPKPSTLLTRFFFRRARIIATNTLIADSIAKTFGTKSDRLQVEPNGVDASVLETIVSKEAAREKLGLPADAPFALYAGRFYGWKELGILSEASRISPLPIAVVGGTQGEFERVTGASAERLQFFGECAPQDVPLWLAAADVLLVLGSTRNESSSRYTTPMKVYEYFAARRPVVAAATPALQSFIPTDAVTWYEPDNAGSLCAAIAQAQHADTARALAEARAHTWQHRAERILTFIHAHGN
ncbi:glycosyltransferase [Candidatus Kaiserbacteria bacterium]|nr:glycosyltransferase [Candidatus Kaiserbacteria bacterium]